MEDCHETPIVLEEFKGSGLGKATIARLEKQGVTFVEQLKEMGEDEINKLYGVSDQEAKDILARANEILAKE